MTSKESVHPIVYRTKTPWSAWFLLVLSILGILATIPLGYLSYAFEITSHGTARSVNSIIPYVCLGSVFGLAALFAIFRLIVNKRVEITFEPQFVRISHKGKQLQIVYTNVQQILRRDELNLFLIFPLRKKEIKIQTAHGIAKIEGNIKNYDAMAAELEARVYPSVYLLSQEVLANKKALKYGTILLNQRGLKLNEKIILWNQVASAEVNRGKVVLRYWQEGKIQEQKIPTSSMPNLPIFLKLAQENIHSAGNV